MTAQSSTGKFYKFGTYYLYKLRTLRPLIIMNGIFALLSYPLVFGLLIPTMNAYEQYHIAGVHSYVNAQYHELQAQLQSLMSVWTASIIIGCAMLVAMFVMNYVIVNKSFRWLYKKTVVDMDYSLPISGNTRFFGDLCASLSASLVPHLIAILLGLALWGFAMPNSTLAWGENLELRTLLDSMLSQLMFTGFAASIMLIAITLFVMSLCGRAREAKVMPLVMNFVIPIIHAVCVSIVLSNIYGVTGSAMNDYMSAAATSPLGLLFMTLAYMSDATSAVNALYWGSLADELQFTAPIVRAEVLVPLILVVLALLAVSYFLITRRRAERTGNPFVNRAVSFAVPAVVTFSVVSIFCYAIFSINSPTRNLYYVYDNFYYSYNASREIGGYVVAALIVTFVLYVIMELVSGKGFKKFYMTLAKYAVTIVGSLLICLGLYYSNGFGAAYYVPNADSVASVEINLSTNTDKYGHINGTVKLPENIQAAVDFHKELPKHSETDEYHYSVGLEYTMKDGTTVERIYLVSEERYKQAINELYSTELFVSANMSDYLLYSAATANEIAVEQIYMNKVDTTAVSCNVPLKEFYNAIMTDYSKGTKDDLAERDFVGVILFCHEEFAESDSRYDENSSNSSYIEISVNVYDWCDNTLALLEEVGFEPHFSTQN